MRCSFSVRGSLVSKVSMAFMNALRVLPLPVGATTSAFLPAAIASHAPSWAGVGRANDASNHARVGALKRSRAVMASVCHRGVTVAPPERLGARGCHDGASLGEVRTTRS